MASRNKVSANTSIFQRLDEYCANRGDPIANAGSARWIETDKHDREFLVYARLVQELALSPSLKLARFDYSDRSYFMSSGLDSLDVPQGLQLEELNGGMLTAFLAEIELRPRVTPIEIRQVLEVGDMSSAGYNGHDFLQVASLFSTIQVFSTEQLVPEESANIFLLLCLSDRRRYEHWINDELASALTEMASVSATAIPYEPLCRAVLDLDPAALFLALYRSLEALYSREQTMGLMSKLGISLDWVKLAQSLEEHLGWYPREQPSLEALLQHAKEDDLTLILAALGENLPANSTIQSFAAGRVYALRNALVHYRPFHQALPFKSIDWCRLCQAMTSLVNDVYAAAPASDPSEEETSSDTSQPEAAQSEALDDLNVVQLDSLPDHETISDPQKPESETPIPKALDIKGSRQGKRGFAAILAAWRGKALFLLAWARNRF